MGVRRVEKVDRAALKETDQPHPGEKPADMGEPGNPASSLSNAHSAAEKLYKKPESEHPSCPDIHESGEKPERDQYQYLSMRIKEEIGPQYPGDRPACADHGDNRIGIDQRMAHSGDEAGEEIEGDESSVTHGIFDVVPKDPKIKHVPGQVHESTMEEHAGYQTKRCREDLNLRRELLNSEENGWDGPIPIDKKLPELGSQRGVVKKHQDIGRDQADTENRFDRGGVVVMEGNHRLRGGSFPPAVVLSFLFPYFHPTHLCRVGQYERFW